MRKTIRTRLGVAVVAAALLGAAAVPAAQATADAGTPSTRRTLSTPYSGVPTTIDPAADLAAQSPAPGTQFADSIYFTSQVKAGGHDFGVLVHTLNMPNQDRRLLAVTVSDEKTGWYKSYEVPIDKNDYHWSTSGLDITMPGLTWTGDAQNMSVKATTPWGALDFHLQTEGRPVMEYAGTGTFSLLGNQQYEYAFPSMRTTGTLTVQGKTEKVSGETWLDRQWGPLSLNSSSFHWTWMNLSLPNGDRVAVWDYAGSTGNAWATVLHPDGSYDLAAVKPLADGAHRFWTSPTSGNSYPTRWTVDIPSLRTHLAVGITGSDAQEPEGDSRYEGTASFSGTYEGKHVTGKNYVEMVGNWKR
ncbi:lipocalin family protein [Streptomyces sp. 7R007]